MKVLLVEDELGYREHLTELLRSWDYEVRAEEDGACAIAALASFTPDVMVTDLVMPKVDGFELMSHLRSEGNLPPTIVMTAFGSVEKAVQIIHELGGFWFIEKPVDAATLRLLINRAGTHGRLAAENEELRRQLSFQGVCGEMVGRTAQMQEIFAAIRQVSPTIAPVLITGESGTGKELVARAIHRYSPRPGGPFVALNCAAMPETLIEAELFGHERGSFTGAIERRLGAIENASGGTLFLDELGEMPLPMQAKLLRVLEDYHFRRIGGKQEIAADIRVIAATNRKPLEAVKEGRLREDLYYRLNVFEINLPPLRERKEDIAPIAEALIFDLNRKHGTRVSGMDDRFLWRLMEYDWPGNVRELRNIIERSSILAGEGSLHEYHLPARLRPGSLSSVEAGNGNLVTVSVRVGSSIEEAEQRLIEATLRHASNNKTRAATILGISTKTLHTKLRQYRLTADPDTAPAAAAQAH